MLPYIYKWSFAIFAFTLVRLECLKFLHRVGAVNWINSLIPSLFSNVHRKAGRLEGESWTVYKCRQM